MGRVTCLGLGLMGSAFARCFVRHGHDVTVWNRDPEKRKPFEGQAKIAASPAEAVAASEITTVCVADYEASDSFLHTDEVAAAAKNTLLCQFTSGSAPDARAGQAWANANGLDYLDCCVLGYPAEVDADAGWFFFSGPRPLFERYADVFNTMSGSVTFVGEPVGSAAALDSALLESYYPGFPRWLLPIAEKSNTIGIPKAIPTRSCHDRLGSALDRVCLAMRNSAP